MNPGDLLVLFTDGLAELRDLQEQFFGEAGISQTIMEKKHLPVKDLAADVLERAAIFSNQVRPNDDLTLFLMRVR